MDHKGEYQKYAFLVMRPGTSQIIQILAIKSNEDRLKKIKEINSKGFYLYYAVIHKDDKTKVLKIRPPYVVDFDSVPDLAKIDSAGAESDGIRCKKCGKSFNSNSGLTNHENAKH
jgi:hypothetical protein